MPKLNDFRQYHYDATVKVSENTRTLAISALAIVWLFKKDNAGTIEVPNDLFLPLLFVLMALTLDFGQYVYRSIVWHKIYRGKEKELEKKEITEDSELYVDSCVNAPAYLLFYSKIVCLAVAYWGLLSYFFHIIKWA